MVLSCTKTRKHSPKYRRRGVQGAAYTEALIILPVFIVCWVGIFFSLNRFSRTQAMQMKARRCLWTYAYRGCVQAAAECEDQPGEETAFAGLFDEEQKAKERIERGKASETGMKRNTSQSKGILDTFINGVLKAIFGAGAKLSPSVEVNRPPIFGGGKSKYGGSRYQQSMMCNTKNQDPGDYILGLIKGFFEAVW